MDKDRQIDVVFMSGETGSGKTTFAKKYCEDAKKSYCVSSSSNDPMQDYKGEDVLILDDLRDSDYKFTDLLKILDNHTKSTVRSRYHNKAFIGEMIIITSYKPLQDWYFDVASENKQQLYRRIKTMYKFTKEKINVFEYDDRMCRYEPICSIPNVICMKAKEQARVAMAMISAMGIELEPSYKDRMNKAIETATDEEWEQIEIEDNPYGKIK